MKVRIKRLVMSEAFPKKNNVRMLFQYKKNCTNAMFTKKISAGIGSSFYNDQNYDTVYFDEELAHDLASWVSGDSMEPKYQNGSVALIRDTGFDYDGAVYTVVCNSKTYIKRVYREEYGLRLVSINLKYRDIFLSYDEDPRIIGVIVGNFIPMES